VEAGVQPRVSTGLSIHAVLSITPSPREGIEDGPRLRARTRSNRAGRGPTRGPPRRPLPMSGVGLCARPCPLLR